mmetsp:Transcript_9675/g.30006  ORF Transcript_9675/g.30006 Transcript_9675/m.30006 type:complete len:396 (-) Transcript_9675:2-1189(-)
MHGNIQLTCARGAGASGGRVQLATLRRPLVSAPEALLRVRLEVRVLERLGRAPPPALEVLLPGRVLLEDAVVAVVRVADAELVGRALLDAVGGVRVLVALAVRAGVVPEDEVQPLAGGDVVGPVALAPEVAYAAALDVLVGVGVLPVVRRAHEAAELQAGAGEVQPQADVEGHVGVVRVHVEPQILALAVAHDEAVVPVPDAAGAGPEELPQRLQRLLELVYEGLEADLVQDDAVVVHAVRPPGGESRGAEVVHLLDEHVAEGRGEHFAGEDRAWQVLGHNLLPGGIRVLPQGRQESGVEPLLAPACLRVEELRVLPQGPVGRGHARLRLGVPAHRGASLEDLLCLAGVALLEDVAHGRRPPKTAAAGAPQRDMLLGAQLGRRARGGRLDADASA